MLKKKKEKETFHCTFSTLVAHAFPIKTDPDLKKQSSEKSTKFFQKTWKYANGENVFENVRDHFLYCRLDLP